MNSVYKLVCQKMCETKTAPCNPYYEGPGEGPTPNLSKNEKGDKIRTKFKIQTKHQKIGTAVGLQIKGAIILKKKLPCQDNCVLMSLGDC